MARRPGGRDPYTVFDLVPEPMRGALRAHPDATFAADMARDWLEADDATRADFLAFFESDGPAKVDQVLEELGLADEDDEGEEWKR
jgi:hypothetical protein